MRVPLIAYIPGAKQNFVVEEMAANLDIAPTMLDIAGISEMPPQFAGASLLPLAKVKKSMIGVTHYCMNITGNLISHRLQLHLPSEQITLN